MSDDLEYYVDYDDHKKAVEELEGKLRKSALQELSALGQASEAYQARLAAEARIEELEAKLEGAVETERQACANVVRHFYENGQVTKPDDIIHRRYPLLSSFGETLHNIIEGQDDE